ncbi:MAG TPA: glycosyltransferase [Pirellulales bacterium]|nr:glycosyltransferase [Pirellulales bacterium]
MNNAEGRRSPLLVFADDWGRHPSSCQHLVRELLPRREVRWVNTIGMRPPRMDAATLRRAAQKLHDWTKPRRRSAAGMPTGLQVCNPRMWPWFRRRFDRRLNRRLLVSQLRGVIQALAESPIGVTTLPITADLMGALPVVRWVYYCVDDFSQWPGLDQKPLAEMEREVVQRADRIIAASEALRERIAGWGRESHLLTHGVDLEHWRLGDSRPSEALKELERPLVLFWGLIDRRIDVEFVRRAASALTQGTVVLLGPEQDPAPDLYRSPRVARVPAVGYDELPVLAREAAALIMPYADQPVTRAMQPLKLKEYLATGKPVVARDLPAVCEWADCLDVVATADEFAAVLRQRLDGLLPESQMLARRRLAEESWAAKAQRFEEVLTGSDEGAIAVAAPRGNAQ